MISFAIVVVPERHPREQGLKLAEVSTANISSSTFQSDIHENKD